MKKTAWFWLLGFAVVWLGLRVFWLDGDPGVSPLWEYGYNVTDEGYYMGAGKDKYLWGAFCDFRRNESFTYGYSPLTHWLSYLGYRLGGLTDWGWRVPFVLFYFAAWMLSFLHVARRCGEKTAFLWCATLSLMPVMVVYERTACNDLLIASLGVIAFCVAAGGGVWRIFVSALVAGAISLVKPSVWIVLPIVAAGILSERKTRKAWLDLALFAAAAIASVWFWRAMALVSLLPEVGRHGMSAAEVLRCTTTHNPLPSLLDYNQFLRGFSSFPRDVCFKALSGVAALVVLLPLAMMARGAILRRASWRLLLYLGALAYVAGVSVNNSICLHYYHPVLMLLPILIAETWSDLHAGEAPREGRLKEVALPLAILSGAVAVLMVFADPSSAKPQEAIAYFSNISNLPQKIVWGFNGGCALLVALATVAVFAMVRGLAALKREGVCWFVCAFAAASVALSNLATPAVARYVKLAASDYVAPTYLVLAVGLAWLAIVFALPNFRLRDKVLAGFAPAVVVLSFLLTPSWRSAAVEMLRPARHDQRRVAAEMAKALPPDAVVLGERSTQVLMGQPFRTATTMPACDPIPIVRKCFEKDAKAPVYGLLDSQNAYNLQHFQKHAGEFRLDLLKKFQLPSFGNGKPADVFFCRVVKLGDGVGPVPAGSGGLGVNRPCGLSASAPAR